MHKRILSLLAEARAGVTLAAADIHLLAEHAPHAALLATAEALTLAGHGRNVGYSRKVFIPLTRLCRDTCAYCTFATTALWPCPAVHVRTSAQHSPRIG